ncbi:tRNA-guanine(15) transglycosylase-like protein [Trichophaea hybrida]|nr:tRNA-guanine(15) transglycosylase-like protein [Trichophaea hybrida]
MFSFRLLPSKHIAGPRLGRLICKNVQIDTPAFIAPTSRGVVPHLSHDNLRDHTDIGGVYVALEDFLEKGIPHSPAFKHPGPLRAFTSHPSNSLFFFAPRRCPPVDAPATNTDHSITILTSVGFRELTANDYISSISHLRPDAVIGMVDIPAQRAGKNRVPKMVYRTELWFNALLKEATKNGIPTFAPVLPVSKELQQLYFQTLEEKVGELGGLAFYDSQLVPEMPETLKELARVAMDAPKNPHKLLEDMARGVDVFTLGFPAEATDAGIVFAFEFPGKVGEGKKQLGWDMWNSPDMATDTGPLAEECNCYSCRRHHRAYVCHLLSAKEMTAWVLLQIHNMHVMNRFFAAARESIAKGTFEEDCKKFAEVYEDELPAKTGEGPRLRGYQFKSTGGPKKNTKAYGKLSGDKLVGDKLEKSNEAETPPDMDAVEMEKSGFAERL